MLTVNYRAGLPNSITVLASYLSGFEGVLNLTAKNLQSCLEYEAIAYVTVSCDKALLTYEFECLPLGVYELTVSDLQGVKLFTIKLINN